MNSMSVASMECKQKKVRWEKNMFNENSLKWNSQKRGWHMCPSSQGDDKKRHSDTVSRIAYLKPILVFHMRLVWDIENCEELSQVTNTIILQF